MPTEKINKAQLEAEKLITLLGLEPGKFNFRFQFIYRQQKFHFYLLIHNLETDEKDSVYLGTY